MLWGLASGGGGGAVSAHLSPSLLTTEGQACSPLARRTLHCAHDHTTHQGLPNGCKSKSLTTLNPIQEDASGNDQAGGHKELLGRLDHSQHFLLIFTQVTNATINT
eukprot:scaffold23915_cov199-Isochrysis_galbana.AAC.1